MKTTIVTARPGHKIRLSGINANETGGVSKEVALHRCVELRRELSLLQRALYAEQRLSLLIVLQAMDTGGKDGAIKNLCAGINPLGIQLTNFKAPTEEELNHDFLWRVHKATPARGMIGLWNRSHYEDVLVVRVQKLVDRKVWKARYDQINSFEKILTQNGITLVKLMLHISKDEQKKRLQDRLDDPQKWWKFNPGDLQARAMWSAYQHAYEDAINLCSTAHAPWHVVPANRKWARDLAILELVLHILKKMRPRYPRPSFNPKDISID